MKKCSLRIQLDMLLTDILAKMPGLVPLASWGETDIN
jgi:hypothetical protein